nr:peptidoglycan DD-metalloendopeptidase family protein [Azomonas agilis]
MLALCALTLTLAGCSSTPSESVSTVTEQKERVTTGAHTVRQGDTLWSIAFRYGWDWKDLAQANNLKPPYVIYPGQQLRFDGGSGTIAPQPTVAASASPTTVRPNVAPTSVAPVAPVVPVVTTTPVAGKASASGWAWPATGALISRFSSNGSLNKGIDIAGQLGQPVLAAGDGTVVYAGSGLRGYGELIIIKHNDTFVSAYGHNQRLLVREGQQVKTGQTIAEMGSTGTDRVKLHFEIRRQGKPVDPLEYLPSR